MYRKGSKVQLLRLTCVTYGPGSSVTDDTRPGVSDGSPPCRVSSQSRHKSVNHRLIHYLYLQKFYFPSLPPSSPPFYPPILLHPSVRSRDGTPVPSLSIGSSLFL